MQLHGPFRFENYSLISLCYPGRPVTYAAALQLYLSAWFSSRLKVGPRAYSNFLQCAVGKLCLYIVPNLKCAVPNN